MSQAHSPSVPAATEGSRGDAVRLARHAIQLVHACGSAAMVLGGMALLGWVFDLQNLKTLLPGAVEMKANTAVGLLACGWVLFVGGHPPSRRLGIAAQAVAAAVVLLGATTLAQYLLGVNLGIDEFLFGDTADAYNVHPGRMAPMSAVAFVCIGVALFTLPISRFALLLKATAGATLLIGTTTLLGYLWSAAELVTGRVIPPIAIHTALGFVLLGAGTLLASFTHVLLKTHSRLILASTEWKVIAGFVGSLVLMATGAGTAYRATAQFDSTAKELVQSQQVRSALAHLSLDVSDAVLAQRSYLVAGQATQLQQWKLLLERIRISEKNLERMLANNAKQAGSLREHSMLTDQFISSQTNEVALYQSQPGAGRNPPSASVDSMRKMLALRTVAQQMDDLENTLLESREEAVSRSRGATLAFMLTTLLVASGALAAIFLSIRREIHDRALVANALNDAVLATTAADRAKSTFLATMSHEIRTPMNGMLGMLELMSLTRLDAGQRATLAVVNASSKSLMRIIDDILDFSKIEAGRMDVHPEAGSCTHLIKGVHGVYSATASSKGVLLSVQIDPRLSPALRLDSARVRQILNNLVSNAIKFTTVGRIELAVELLERSDGRDRVQFSVKDTGTGISPASQKLLFEPFTQVPNDTLEGEGGTGLGLSISRRLAELMGGTLEMQSEVGTGTTMRLTLWLSIADPKELPPSESDSALEILTTTNGIHRTAPAIPQAEAEGTLVLVVDDHPTNRALISRQINLLGYACEVAADGAEALENWKSGRFGLVITDCRMPVMDGYALARNLREFEAAHGRSRTPVVACTATALEGEAERCLMAGMDDCLVKPFDLAQLLKKLDRWLPIPRQVLKAAQAPSPGAAQPMSEALDLSLIAATWGEGDANLREALSAFRRSNEEDSTALRRAISAGDMTGITTAAHRMLGASKMVGAQAFADVCERIDAASRASDWTALTTALQDFNEESARLDADLERFGKQEILE